MKDKIMLGLFKDGNIQKYRIDFRLYGWGDLILTVEEMDALIERLVRVRNKQSGTYIRFEDGRIYKEDS